MHTQHKPVLPRSRRAHSVLQGTVEVDVDVAAAILVWLSTVAEALVVCTEVPVGTGLPLDAAPPSVLDDVVADVGTFEIDAPPTSVTLVGGTILFVAIAG